jgi:hypothetical protein
MIRSQKETEEEEQEEKESTNNKLTAETKLSAFGTQFAIAEYKVYLRSGAFCAKAIQLRVLLRCRNETDKCIIGQSLIIVPV